MIEQRTEMSSLQVAQSIGDNSFVFLPGSRMKTLLEATGPLSDWTAVVNSWDELELDTYLGDQRRFRKRRYAVYDLEGTSIAREPHQPHHQKTEYNPLFGGIERWFAPITPSVGEGPTLRTILSLCRTIFGALGPSVLRWHVEVHQIRIEAGSGELGYPTPEGIHRDGVDYVLVLLIRRSNIASGTTTVHGEGGRQLGSFTLTDPFDAALLDDSRVAHGVTPVTPLDPGKAAYRDVLVVTFRRHTM
ncbi:MAG TPA: 2OG-Fe dioxygenase family protein [Vicinamibacterales bacterium]|jgi:hypothetical protein|nr:2OG-Fe dioxygenase family protein [Vicinamibacterales bacterium]